MSRFGGICKNTHIGIGIFGESKPIVSKIVMQDEDHDIAVLNIDRKKCKFLPLNSECDLGDNIFSHGFSIQHLPTFPDGFPVKSTLTGMTTSKNRKTEVIVLEETEVDNGLRAYPKNAVTNCNFSGYNSKSLLLLQYHTVGTNLLSQNVAIKMKAIEAYCLI